MYIVCFNAAEFHYEALELNSRGDRVDYDRINNFTGWVLPINVKVAPGA